eukprot:353872-Chlamydomonas_euryale.AAC.7
MATPGGHGVSRHAQRRRDERPRKGSSGALSFLTPHWRCGRVFNASTGNLTQPFRSNRAAVCATTEACCPRTSIVS